MALALLFDLDGTLIETIDAIVASMNAALAEVGERPLTKEELRPLIGMPVSRQLDRLRGMSGPVVDTITDRYYVHFMGFVERGLPLYPGVEETFPRLAGRAIGTMTTRRRDGAKRMLEVAGLLSYFRTVVGGDEVSRPKPYPDLPLHSAGALGVPPEACAIIGDSPVDILAGRAARMWTIAVTYGYGDPKALREAKPHELLSKFADLPRVLDDFDARAVGSSGQRGATP